MLILISLLSLVLSAVAIVCWVIVLIDAFSDGILKGVGCLLCGLYWLYYAIAEFEHQNKWLIILGTFAGGIGSALMKAYTK